MKHTEEQTAWPFVFTLYTMQKERIKLWDVRVSRNTVCEGSKQTQFLKNSHQRREKPNVTCISVCDTVTCISVCDNVTCISVCDNVTCMSVCDNVTCMSVCDNVTCISVCDVTCMSVCDNVTCMSVCDNVTRISVCSSVAKPILLFTLKKLPQILMRSAVWSRVCLFSW
jgi:hypothetical protein